MENCQMLCRKCNLEK
ncbi:hypothetical protein IKI14_02230 [bacterium]|nr:hypothetical protein [bacterium]